MKLNKTAVLIVLLAVIAVATIIAAYYGTLNQGNQNTATSNTPQPTIAPTPPANLQIFSPQNKTYLKTQVYLNATANSTTSKIVYSFDGTRNWTLSENTSIFFNEGSHNVTFYAFSKSGNLLDWKVVTFEVKPQSLYPDPPPTRKEAIDFFASEGFVVQNKSSLIIDEYYDPGAPTIKNASAVDTTTLAFHAKQSNITMIYEFNYDTTSESIYSGVKTIDNIHWTIFYIEEPNSNTKFIAYTLDAPPMPSWAIINPDMLPK